MRYSESIKELIEISKALKGSFNSEILNRLNRGYGEYLKENNIAPNALILGPLEERSLRKALHSGCCESGVAEKSDKELSLEFYGCRVFSVCQEGARFARTGSEL